MLRICDIKYSLITPPPFSVKSSTIPVQLVQRHLMTFRLPVIREQTADAENVFLPGCRGVWFCYRCNRASALLPPTCDRRRLTVSRARDSRDRICRNRTAIRIYVLQNRHNIDNIHCSCVTLPTDALRLILYLYLMGLYTSNCSFIQPGCSYKLFFNIFSLKNYFLT